MIFWKRLIVLLIGLISFTVSSQIFCYCDVIESDSGVKVVYSNNPVYISKDFQQKMLCDIETNKPIKFKNAVDCISHLGIYGWKVVGTTHNGNITKYTLQNQLSSPYQIEGRLERDMRILEEYEKQLKK